ncbi:MAG: hypothetical protein ABL902_03760 [Gallionella sp.]
MKAIKLLLVMLASFIVVACGGGGGSSPAASTTLSGTAAVGAPIVGAAVNVKCAAGTALSNIPVTSATGAWSVTLSGQTFPCAVQVSGGTISGAANTITYQSIANAYGIVNVTPLTDLLVANLAGSSAALTSVQLSTITPANIATALTNLRAALGLNALNTLDPITTAFTPTSNNAMDNILAALQMAMTNSGTSYASLLASATSATFTTPANFKTALTTAYSSMGSGTAAQYFSKKAVGYRWTWGGSNSSEVMTVTASTGGVATFTDTYTSGGTTYPTDTGTLQLNAAGAWTATVGTYTGTLLPATFAVGTSWLSKPADPAAGYSGRTSTIAAFNVTRTVPAGTFTDCLQVNSTSSSTNAGVTTVSNSTDYYSPTAGISIETINVGGSTTQLQTYGTVQVNGTAAQYFSKKAVGNTWTWFDTSTNSTSTSSRAFTVTASAGNVVTVSTSKNGGAPSAGTLRFDATGAWVFTSGTYSTVILPATFSVGTTWVAEPANSVAGISATTDTIVAFNVTRTAPSGTFTDCLQVNSTYTYTQQPSGFTTTYNSTRYYSPTAGMYVDGISSDSNASAGTEQLQAGYIANP